jgi:hypothetical protein
VENNPEFREVVEPQNCYICKKDYSTIHHFYDQLCPKCADLNFRKRTELADLRGRVALLTGGRVKIGYQAGIKLLRAGAQLIVTTRFPRDSAMRYAQEPDFAEWGSRLEIFGLDLRHTPSVEAFCQHMMRKYSRLDFIINNACQTVRRPPDFYAHMMAQENGALHNLPENARQLLGAYEGLRGYHMLPEADAAREDARPTAALLDQKLSEVAGLTHAAELSQVPLLPEELAAQQALFPQGRQARSRSPTGGLARAQLLAHAHARSARRGIAGGATRQRRRAVHPQCALEALDDAHARAGQTHRQRVCRGRAVLSEVQDHAPSAHQHGQGRA